MLNGAIVDCLKNGANHFFLKVPESNLDLKWSEHGQLHFIVPYLGCEIFKSVFISLVFDSS